MNKSWMLSVCTALLAAPFAVAHEPMGAPKYYCEDPSEWFLHDYGDPPLMDTVVPAFSSALPGGHAKGEYFDGNLFGDCNGDTVPADFDEHREWSPTTHALILAESGDGVTSGSIACWGERAHHGSFGPISAFDALHGSNVLLHMSADFINLVPPTDPAAPNCGDYETDADTHCLSPCSVTFPPGLDGAYHILIGAAEDGGPGTFGHVWS